MEPERNKYIELLKVDKDRLDEEWERVPVVMEEVADDLRRYGHEVDRLQRAFDLIVAKVDSDIRDDPSEYDISRISESAITRAMATVPEWQEADEALRKAKRRYSYLETVVRSAFQRRAVLENLTRLFLSDYYAETQITDQEREEYTERIGRAVHHRQLQKAKERRQGNGEV